MRNELPIQFSNVTKMFGSKAAVYDVSFDVEPGQVFALLGENGAGKTTSIRMMMGMLDVDGGSIRVLGKDSATEHRSIRETVGYVSDQPSLYAWMSVERIGWFAAGFYPAGFQEEYRRLTEHFGLNGSDRIKSLSKGMRAKVALSLALAHKPPLLVLDEPTSGLDTLVRRDFLESMVDIAAEGRTVFLSSHQIPEVERVADTIAIMSRGRLLMIDSMDHLKRTTSQVIITTTGALSPNLTLPNVVHQEEQGRQVRAIVRHEDELDLSEFSSSPSVQGVEVIHPNLEEIYVAYMRSADPVESQQVLASAESTDAEEVTYEA